MSGRPPRPDGEIAARLRAAARPDEVISPITPWLLDRGRWWSSRAAGAEWPARLVAGVIEPRRGHRFRPENVALAALLVGDAVSPAERVCELGAGSGSLLLTALAFSADGARGVAVERQPEAVERLTRTLEAHGLAGRATVVGDDLRDVSALDAVRDALGGPADLVVCNPPWFPASWGRASADTSVHASTHALHGDVGDFVKAATRLLRGGAGRCLVVYDAARAVELLVAAGEASLRVRRMLWLPDARAERGGEATRVWLELVTGAAGALVERL